MGKKGKTKSEKDSTSKPIKHDANTFQLFSKLKLDAPITTDDVPALLEKLEAQLEDYQNKVKDWEEKKEEMKRKILSVKWTLTISTRPRPKKRLWLKRVAKVPTIERHIHFFFE